MSAIYNDVLGSALTLVEAAKRVAALAIVDTAVAVPQAKGICDVALGALALRPSDGSNFLYYRPSTRPSALLVLCHPSGGPSMCSSLAKAWEDSLKEVGVEVNRVDLDGQHQLGLKNSQELQAALTGRHDPAASGEPPGQIAELQALVEASQFLVFVHPIFWFEVPAQLKGFQESVLSSGFAFRKLPNHWLMNRAAGVIERVPVARTYMRRYAAYGLLRDKSVYITRTQGGPSAGMGIFGHQVTSLESSLQFCGAHISSVDVVAELDGMSRAQLEERVFPQAEAAIRTHCRAIARKAQQGAHLKALTDCEACSK